MKNRILLIGFFIGMTLLMGCRTGEYNVDLAIYQEMPALLAADTALADIIAKNPDGSLMVTFEKGEMSLHLRAGSDMNEEKRQVATSDAFVVFHQAYLNHPENVKKDGTFYRQKIYIHTFVDTTELYILEWDLGEPDPHVTNDRSGNYM
jgi:hypothetical protein